MTTFLFLSLSLSLLCILNYYFHTGPSWSIRRSWLTRNSREGCKLLGKTANSTRSERSYKRTLGQVCYKAHTADAMSFAKLGHRLCLLLILCFLLFSLSFRFILSPALSSFHLTPFILFSPLSHSTPFYP